MHYIFQQLQVLGKIFGRGLNDILTKANPIDFFMVILTFIDMGQFNRWQQFDLPEHWKRPNHRDLKSFSRLNISLIVKGVLKQKFAPEFKSKIFRSFQIRGQK